MKFSELKINDRIMEGGSYRFARIIGAPCQIEDGTWKVLVEWEGGFRNHIWSVGYSTYYRVECIENE